jgi:hypothetical protein
MLHRRIAIKYKRKLCSDNNPQVLLTRYSFCKLLFSFKASAIAFAPASPIRLLACIAHVTPGEK